jgi:aryl carrier-like protein
MSNVKISKRIPLNQFSHSVRFGQALAPFGAGAMVDFKDQTLMAATPKAWSQFQEIHDERLEKLLNVNRFCLPPSKDWISGLPFVRFPQWYFCPSCKTFKPLKVWEKEYVPGRNAKRQDMLTPRCMECNRTLVPAGIVVACSKGHIDDFPWLKWVHYKSKREICSDSVLKIKNSSSALGLEGLIIECKCGAKASLNGAFNKDVFGKMGKGFECTGNMPWKGQHDKSNCQEIPRSVQRGALNIYFPKVISSIVIPPYSSEINTLVKESKKFTTMMDLITDDYHYVESIGLNKFISNYALKIADEIHQDKGVVEIILNKYLSPRESGDVVDTKEEYRQEEYKALIGDIPKECMSEKDFKIEIQKDIESYGMDQISKITLVKKLREVRALVGFSRLEPCEQNSMSRFDDEVNTDSRFVSIKEKDMDWYPAYETRGEGIFIEINENGIDKWISENPEVSHRVNLLEKRYNERGKLRGDSIRKITPKFVLLHTLAHLLIKELSFECGYNSASLTERIYCNTDDRQMKMSGILIYTSSGDSEGTLGGLVRQGKSDMLPRVLRNAIRKAIWCSSDPVCIESTVQGRDGLNLAACHACLLISETSCEEFNILLDRVLVVGTLENRKMGFFN